MSKKIDVYRLSFIRKNTSSKEHYSVFVSERKIGHKFFIGTVKKNQSRSQWECHNCDDVFVGNSDKGLLKASEILISNFNFKSKAK
jgi:hypothetical protein